MLYPSLGRRMTPEQRDEARSALPVRVARLRKGKLDLGPGRRGAAISACS